MKKTLYLECNSGISGDMTVGALLDLGADRKVLEDALASLGVDGYHLHFGTTEKCGIKAYDFDVHLEYEEHVHEHCHDHDHEHTHDHGDHDHDHGNVPDQLEGHVPLTQPLPQFQKYVLPAVLLYRKTAGGQ